MKTFYRTDNIVEDILQCLVCIDCEQRVYYWKKCFISNLTSFFIDFILEQIGNDRRKNVESFIIYSFIK